MSRQTRTQIIKNLEEARKGRTLISYITSTRPGHEYKMAMDSVRFIFEHLKNLKCEKNKTKIDLFIHSNGGDGVVPWRLVTLIREHCKEFDVLVPNRAFSAATLTALGADHIIMHSMGVLGPTDPKVGNEFNPVDPLNPGNLLGINVEDVSAFTEFVAKDFKITRQDQAIEALKVLSEKVHPLALGNVKRFHAQSRMMARKLLQLHMDQTKDKAKIDSIVKSLTSELFFHGHPINRKEASDLKLDVVLPDERVESIMWQLYREYEEEMLLEEPFNFAMEFTKKHPSLPLKPGVQQAVANTASILDPKIPASDYVTINPEKLKNVYVESTSHANIHTVNYSVTGVQLLGGNILVTPSVLRQGWEIELDTEAPPKTAQEEVAGGRN